MTTELREGQRYSPDAKANRRVVLKETIADGNRLITNLEVERDALLLRLSKIPGCIATVQEWLNRSTEELERLEGNDISNGHSTEHPISLQVLEPTSVGHP